MAGKRLIDGLLNRVERVVFGASAQETVDLRTRLAAQNVMARLAAKLEDDEPHPCEQCGMYEAYGERRLCDYCDTDDHTDEGEQRR